MDWWHPQKKGEKPVFPLSSPTCARGDSGVWLLAGLPWQQWIPCSVSWEISAEHVQGAAAFALTWRGKAGLFWDRERAPFQVVF